MNLRAIIGSKIKIARKEKGFTQKQLGDKTGLSRTSIINIEKGDQMPCIKTLYKFCAPLEKSVHYFLPYSSSSYQQKHSK